MKKRMKVLSLLLGVMLGAGVILAGCGGAWSVGNDGKLSITGLYELSDNGSDRKIGKTQALLSEYWTENSSPAEELNDYLQAVVDPSSPDYIPVKDRIAVFDLDGTLMCETYPWCFEYMVFADYALNSGSDNVTEEVKAVAQEILDSAWGEKPSGMSTRQATAGAIAYQGMTMPQLHQMVEKFKESKAEGFVGMKRGEAFFKPMVELFETLQKNDFTVYVVTATERNIVRCLIEDVLNIPPAHVIGTEYGYTATGQGDTEDTDYTFAPSDSVVFDGNYYGENAKTSKVDSIVREIGQQPVLAFGNSSGDLAMEIYTISNNPYRSAAYMVLADDEEREYGDAEAAAEKRNDYEAQGIGVISMRDDFKTIYGENVNKEKKEDISAPTDEALLQNVESERIANPWGETQSLSVASEWAGLDFGPSPEVIRLEDGRDMSLTTYRYMTGTIEALYQEAEYDLVIRKSSDVRGDDLAGDYNVYRKEWEEVVGDTQVYCKGDGDTINVAYFEQDDEFYSVTFHCGEEGKGLTISDLSAIVAETI